MNCLTAVHKGGNRNVSTEVKRFISRSFCFVLILSDSSKKLNNRCNILVNNVRVCDILNLVKRDIDTVLCGVVIV